ncbi:MAG: hypothetical protein ACI9E1_000239 [Cryomorphaceae bacterium]|jgi:hypothetical protein
MNALTTLLIMLSLNAVTAKEFTIMSYNIKHGVNMQGELKLAEAE